MGMTIAVDVLVIGGGIAGLSLAASISRRAAGICI